ncbi:hypothetical protein IWQ62_001024 [Dispira parvispora]|uniref:Pentatricopeptide repeat domain-containing protein n=1 Tax=Dispira parvispora TaxID=1520584 RepID=A0A9W8AYV0_9FUNG|nr:hypothetical protein IWQ62_001024 [Dispira parvispora]
MGTFRHLPKSPGLVLARQNGQQRAVGYSTRITLGSITFRLLYQSRSYHDTFYPFLTCSLRSKSNLSRSRQWIQVHGRPIPQPPWPLWSLQAFQYPFTRARPTHNLAGTRPPDLQCIHTPIINFRTALQSRDIDAAWTYYGYIKSRYIESATENPTVQEHPHFTPLTQSLMPTDYYLLLDQLATRYSRETSRFIIILCEDLVANRVPLTEAAQAHLIRACYLLAEYSKALAYLHSWYPSSSHLPDLRKPPFRDPYAWGCLWTYSLACHRLVHRSFTQIFDMYTNYVQLGGQPHQLMMQQLTCALIDDVRWQKSHLTRLAHEWQLHFPSATPMFWSFMIVTLLRSRRWAEVMETFEVAQTLDVVFPRPLVRYALKRLFRNGQLNRAQHLWHGIICVPQCGTADSGSSNSAILDEFPYLSTGTINVYVDGLIKHGYHIEAEQLVGALAGGAQFVRPTCTTRRTHPMCTKPTSLALCSAFSATIHTFTVMIQGYLSAGDLDNALRIIEHIGQIGLAWDAALTDVVCRGLLRLYYTFTPNIPLAEFDKLFGKLVDAIPTPTHAEITTLHYDLIEYNVVHKLLRKARAHGTLDTPDPSLTALYQRTLGHLLTNDDITLQRSLEIATQTHDLAALLSFLLERGHTHRAVGLFTMCLLPPHRVQPTPVIVNILVRGLAQQGLDQEAAALLDGDQLSHPRLKLEGYLVLFRAYCSQSNLTGALTTFTKLCKLDIVASPVISRAFNSTNPKRHDTRSSHQPDPPEGDTFDAFSMPWRPEGMQRCPPVENTGSLNPTAQANTGSIPASSLLVVPWFAYASLFHLLFTRRLTHQAQELYTAFIEIVRRFELAEEYAENGLSSPSTCRFSVMPHMKEPDLSNNGLSTSHGLWASGYDRPRWNKRMVTLLLHGWVRLHQRKLAHHVIRTMNHQQIVPKPLSALDRLVKRAQSL